jgi:tetratricopeptide (TPR) repeat protein
VFISSTFLDMQKERDHLVKYTFPKLRQRCRERCVEFVDVDLRWGITEEQKAEGQVLPICLAEIERCRPYFIGLLGERYGWVPEEVEEELVRVHRLKVHKGCSVTELEILHGILNSPEMRRLAFFYFRDARTSKAIEERLSQEPGYEPESEASGEKLKGLKEKIRQSGYLVREDFPDPKALEELVLEDLWHVIDERFPRVEVPTALEQERMEHEAYAEARTRVYIGREEYFERLDEKAKGEEPPLMVLGESGSGKSALLANWVELYRKKHPDDFVIMHFTGSTPDSADYTRIIGRIMGEIKERYAPEDKGEVGGHSPSVGTLPGAREENEIPTDPKKLVEHFPLWLARASARGRLILVLDGLNQLEDLDNAPDLGWLTEYFPPNIRVILSTLPGRSHDALRKRGLTALKVEPLNVDERREYIREYLGQYTKELSPSSLERIATSNQSSNPLYLRALLEELRLYGDHVTLKQRIEYYLGAETVASLYGRILERYEEDYERDRPGLVRELMSLIWASRRGLSEVELLELLGSKGTPLPNAYWSPLHLAVEESLVNHSGLLSFFHDFLRIAVEDRYLDTSTLRNSAHLRLANYFQERDLDDRRVEELPWQWRATEEWERLKESVTDLEMFMRLNTEAGMYELMGYWHSLGSRYDMVESYKDSLAAYEERAPSKIDLSLRLFGIANFLKLGARYEGAEPLFRRALEILEKVLGPENPSTATCLSNLALLLYEKGDYEGAAPLYRRALEIDEKVLGPENPSTAKCLSNLALLLYAKGDYEGAEPLYRRALEIRERALGPEHPYTATCLSLLALLLHSKGDYEGAEPLYRRALGILEKTLGPEHLEMATSLDYLAKLLEDKRDYEGAEPLYRRALEIDEKVLGPEHPYTAWSLNGLAGLLYAKGDYERAEPLYRRALGIYEMSLGFEHPYTAIGLSNLALLLYAKGDYERAEPLYRRALEIEEKILGPEHPSTAWSLNGLATLLRDKGDGSGAAEIYERLIEIHENDLQKSTPVTPELLKMLARIHNEVAFHGEVPAKNWQKAEHHYRRAIELMSQLDNPIETANMELNLQILFQLSGQPVDLARIKERIRILEEAGDHRAGKGHELLKKLS